jgi:uncharacterized protein (TIGR02996 family)
MTAGIEAGFLEDILDHPDDDAPRLIYADWLTDRGRLDDEARAELIRIGCQQARLSPNDPGQRWLKLRTAQLLRLFESRWLPADWRSPDQGNWQRGFFRVQTRLWPFLTWGESWFRHPAVLESEVAIRGTEDGGFLRPNEEHVRFLAQTPLLARVTQLSIRGRHHPADVQLPGDDIARAVAHSPHAGRLRRLEVSCLSDAGARALVESSTLASLEQVSLYAFVELSPVVLRLLQGRFQVQRFW